MKKIERHKNARPHRVHHLPEDINAVNIREMFSEFGRVGYIRIYSKLGGETFAFFSLFDEIVGEPLPTPIIWRGQRFPVEDDWDYS